MQAALADIRERLLIASGKIPESYFLVPTAGSKHTVYRERVYCYELYHCWRQVWPEKSPFSICGELDKSGHEFIDRPVKPDFVVHCPGDMRNLVVVEVKSAGNVTQNLEGAVKDLETLNYFRTEIKNAHNEPANYVAAYFWVYGLRLAEWPTLREGLLAYATKAKLSVGLISCFIHERPNSRAVEVFWK